MIDKTRDPDMDWRIKDKRKGMKSLTKWGGYMNEMKPTRDINSIQSSHVSHEN